MEVPVDSVVAFLAITSAAVIALAAFDLAALRWGS